jgi:hypothetical protein
MRAGPVVLVVAACGACAHREPRPVERPALRPGAAYLQLEQVRVVPTGRCVAYEPFVEVRATITNAGELRSPAFVDQGLVAVRLVDPTADYGNGAGVPSLAPGESIDVRIPVFYPTGRRDVLAASDRFWIQLDVHHAIPEDILDRHVETVVLPGPVCVSTDQLAS